MEIERVSGSSFKVTITAEGIVRIKVPKAASDTEAETWYTRCLQITYSPFLVTVRGRNKMLNKLTILKSDSKVTLGILDLEGAIHIKEYKDEKVSYDS